MKRVRLLSGNGREGTVLKPSWLVENGWLIAWDRSNIATHEEAGALDWIEERSPERKPAGRAELLANTARTEGLG